LRTLAQAIESLPPRCRDVFVLHKIHEWPQAQVAAHLGISIKTVEKHMRTALACCRFALRDWRDWRDLNDLRAPDEETA
jgi:RNA polymerase sigma-70 factor (ECF subfamily)